MIQKHMILLLCAILLAVAVSGYFMCGSSSEQYRGGGGGGRSGGGMGGGRAGGGGRMGGGMIGGRGGSMIGGRGGGMIGGRGGGMIGGRGGLGGRGGMVIGGRGGRGGGGRGGGGRGGRGGRGGHHHHHYYPSGQGWGYTALGWPYWRDWNWWWPYDYPINTVADIATYASPDWCWSKVTMKDVGMPSDTPEKKKREEWIKWAKEMGMTVLLFPGGSNDYILVQSTQDCFLASNANLSEYEFRSISY